MISAKINPSRQPKPDERLSFFWTSLLRLGLRSLFGATLLTLYENTRHISDAVGSQIRRARRQAFCASLVSVALSCFDRFGCKPVVCGAGVDKWLASNIRRFCFGNTHRGCSVAPDQDASGVFISHRKTGADEKSFIQEMTAWY